MGAIQSNIDIIYDTNNHFRTDNFVFVTIIEWSSNDEWGTSGEPIYLEWGDDTPWWLLYYLTHWESLWTSINVITVSLLELAMLIRSALSSILIIINIPPRYFMYASPGLTVLLQYKGITFDLQNIPSFVLCYALVNVYTSSYRHKTDADIHVRICAITYISLNIDDIDH